LGIFCLQRYGKAGATANEKRSFLIWHCRAASCLLKTKIWRKRETAVFCLPKGRVLPPEMPRFALQNVAFYIRGRAAVAGRYANTARHLVSAARIFKVLLLFTNYPPTGKMECF
jgi:hypothetical protein